MLRKRIIHLVLVVLFAAAIITPRPAAAETTYQGPKLIQLLFPRIVTAGTQVTFEAQVTTDPAVGICCGSLQLIGPGGQRHEVELKRSGAQKIAGTLELSPYTPAGTWSIDSLFLIDGDNRFAGVNGPWSMTVLPATGKAPDIWGPSLVSVDMPSWAHGGDPVTITVKATDALSGISHGLVQVQPYNIPGAEMAIWYELRPTGKPGELQSVALMEPNVKNGALVVTGVQLFDKAGNRTQLGLDQLLKSPANHLATDGTTGPEPESYATEPYLSVIHPGPTVYYNWAKVDKAYLLSNLHLIDQNPQLVRERLMAELGQLQVAVHQLQWEIMYGPDTDLQFVPYATTGKWLVLDRAIELRTLLLVELDRREGLTVAAWAPLTDEEITYLEDLEWTPIAEPRDVRLGGLSAAYINALSKSPEALQVLNAPPLKRGPSTLEPNLVYFVPAKNTLPLQERYGIGSLWVGTGRNFFTSDVQAMFYQVGEQLVHKFFPGDDAVQMSTSWGPYKTLRGNQEWPVPSGSWITPMDNMVKDFQVTYMPFDLGKSALITQSYPDLRTNPSMQTAFRQLVADKLKEPAPAFTLTPGSNTVLWALSNQHDLLVGPGEGPSISLSEGYGRAVLQDLGPLAQKAVTARTVSPSLTDKALTFAPAGLPWGRVGYYDLNVSSLGSLAYSRTILYVRTPAVLAPIPVATNEALIVVTGVTIPGATVKIGSKSFKAIENGFFTLQVPLVPGLNNLRLTVDGSPLGAAFQVTYEPVGTKVPVTVDMPWTTSNPDLVLTGRTVPLATVEMSGSRAQADINGVFTVYLNLRKGLNRYDIKVTSPAGNTGAWSGTIELK